MSDWIFDLNVPDPHSKPESYPCGVVDCDNMITSCEICGECADRFEQSDKERDPHEWQPLPDRNNTY